VIFLNSYDNLFVEAAEEYKRLPFEAKELYKRYNFKLEIPACEESLEKDALEMAAEIEKKTGIKFDAVITGSGVTSSGKFITIKKAEKKRKEREHDTVEGKIANFIMEGADSNICVEINEGENANIKMLFIADKNLPVKIVINVGKRSKVEIFEWFASLPEREVMMAPFQTIVAGESSDVEINMLHNCGEKAITGSLSRTIVEKRGKARINIVYNGSSLTKATNSAYASGEESDLLVNELVFGSSSQRFDINTFIANNNEKTRAILESGALLKDSSFCILKGYAKVGEGARGSHSNVEERGMLLDPMARVEPLPDMSIDYGNEVTATHSASTAPIDPEVLFYLNSRGLDEKKAKRIFLTGFVMKYINKIIDRNSKSAVAAAIIEKADRNSFGKIFDVRDEELVALGIGD
jgi:Fe-S cluster assembly scaffold protein SufB